jgi:hypothetical protein
MITTILLIVAAVIAVVLIVAACQGNTFHIERSVVIAAPPAEIFPQLNELRKVNAWSPWLAMDPAAKITYDGPAAGVGGTSAWVGNRNIGEGRQTIVESRPNERVLIKLEFLRPMAGLATADFSLRPQGGGTTVTWGMDGSKNFVSKIFCLFMNQDKMIGGQFEKGLATLKTRVESPATAKQS